MIARPVAYPDVESCVEATLSRIGRRICLGTPLELGKANHLVNEFFRRAREDPGIELHIFTAPTLGRPRWKGERERRFLEPLSQRLFGGYPEIAYLEPLRRSELPANIRVSEFYFQPGSMLRSPLAQQQYVSSNYTHVVRDVLDAGLNVLAQQVAKSEEDGATHLSLSCNPDLTLDLAPQMRAAERRGGKIALLAQVNRQLPFMYGDAVVTPDYFDGIVDQPRYDFPLFAPPNTAVSTADYLIALHVSALIRDGGTPQLGIGSLGDAVTYLLKLRHQQNQIYGQLLSEAGVTGRFAELVQQVGGAGPFEQGLYGASEMLVDGFLELSIGAGFSNVAYTTTWVSNALNTGAIGCEVTPATLEANARPSTAPRYLPAPFLPVSHHGFRPPDRRARQSRSAAFRGSRPAGGEPAFGA